MHSCAASGSTADDSAAAVQMLMEVLVPRAHARLSEQDIRDAVQTVHAEDPCWFELTREDVTDVASSYRVH